jgi:hypothetical protein
VEFGLSAEGRGDARRGEGTRADHKSQQEGLVWEGKENSRSRNLFEGYFQNLRHVMYAVNWSLVVLGILCLRVSDPILPDAVVPTVSASTIPAHPT